MTNYARGVKVERELINLLKNNGWDVVRGAGSKGKLLGIDADFVATKTTRDNEQTCLLVVGQVKVSKRKKQQGGQQLPDKSVS